MLSRLKVARVSVDKYLFGSMLTTCAPLSRGAAFPFGSIHASSRATRCMNPTYLQQEEAWVALSVWMDIFTRRKSKDNVKQEQTLFVKDCVATTCYAVLDRTLRILTALAMNRVTIRSCPDKIESSFNGQVGLTLTLLEIGSGRGQRHKELLT